MKINNQNKKGAKRPAKFMNESYSWESSNAYGRNGKNRDSQENADFRVFSFICFLFFDSFFSSPSDFFLWSETVTNVNRGMFSAAQMRDRLKNSSFSTSIDESSFFAQIQYCREVEQSESLCHDSSSRRCVHPSLHARRNKRYSNAANLWFG